MTLHEITQHEINLTRAIIAKFHIADKGLADECESNALFKLLQDRALFDPARASWISFAAFRILYSILTTLRSNNGSPLSGVGEHNTSPPAVEFFDTAREDEDWAMHVDTFTPEILLASKQATKIFLNAIHSLPEGRRRDACRMYFIDGETMTDIARTWGVSLPRVSFLVSKGRARLLEELEPAREAGELS